MIEFLIGFVIIAAVISVVYWVGYRVNGDHRYILGNIAQGIIEIAILAAILFTLVLVIIFANMVGGLVLEILR